ncbi:DUF4406 domain-containing protein [Salmonella enterica subsp. enterica serovar Newport]|nr:DUF4406 domain-containing protein [Salmonella enterica subsp. enterica serovar Newport]
MKIYIAGPMTGREKFNRDAFNKEADRLMKHGHTVLNPASLPDGLAQREYMDICFAMLRCADAIMMLPGCRHPVVLRLSITTRTKWSCQFIQQCIIRQLYLSSELTGFLFYLSHPATSYLYFVY